MILMIVACGSNDDPGDALVLTIDRSDIIASNPDWSVVSFINDGKDKSVDFNNYSFEIFSNGDFLINLNGLNDSFGRWSISSDELILTINISNPKPTTSGIVGDWNVTAKSGSALTLESADGTNKTCRLSK
jgi:hypothetical protein